VKFLLKGGADVHALNKWRETPLLTAANHGQVGAVEALLAADADPCKCTDTGWSPLSIAAYKGHDEVVRLLLEDGAPTEEDDPTLSALLQAATKGLPDTVELLLRHGADHTVTTKKGDTALSILVEQNLIDAAVEMVTEYNASIPRCSRDRKKVQRARLLINLRMKQLEREGKDDNDSTDDDEESDEDHSSNAIVAQHVDTGSLDGSAVAKSGKKNKKGKPKESAEEKARLAEEALLQELEKEDAEAKKEEAKANSKTAKKKKKKERDRLQKMKEDEERRQQEEREATERDRIRKEKEERRRQEREEQEKAEREREIREMMEREKGMAAKRKEREERERRERSQKPQGQRGSGSVSPTESRSSTEAKAQKGRKAATDPTPNRKIASPQGGTKPTVPLVGNRRWETAAKEKSDSDTPQSSVEPARLDRILNFPQSVQKPDELIPSTFLSPRFSRRKSGEAASGLSYDTSSASVSSSPQSIGPLNGSHASHSQFVGGALEHPAITLFRREKVTELLQRCTQAINLVGDLTIKHVLYRWIVRASHGNTPYSDPIIPSWIDSDQLIAYFQRQFIAESRRQPGASVTGPSMESLKDAGSSVAGLCQDLAKQVVAFRHRIDEQLSPDWTDAALGMSASGGTLTGSGSVVTVSWANRAQIFLPSLTFATLRDRHVGPPTRLLAAVFVTRILYETTQLIVADTNMDVRLSPNTQASLSAEAGVSAELWSDPFSTLNSNVFWGHFEQVDALFGGQKPFGKDEHGSEEVLARHGGSLSAFLPLDAMVASQYVQRMVDILDSASAASVPVSFAVFMGADCFLDLPRKPSASDLRTLDPRLGEQQSVYVTRVEALQAGQHSYFGGEGAGTPKICPTNSLFVMLQNDPGKSRYNVGDISASRIVATMSLSTPSHNDAVIATSMGLASDFRIRESGLSQHTGYFDGIDPISPDPQRVVRSDFGAIGGSSLSNTFSPVHDPFPRGGRRGRLFDLVDDGDEEHLNDDIMSGMLNNLDVGLFQNANIGSDNVDIEAISLMGIGGPPRSSLANSGSAHPGRLG
jgi:ankyrin repeat protein